jgi:formylglycine-generating enzyme required for sulfatase activity
MANEFVCQSSQQNCANHPQVCVDWCDAQAYCEAHGKRLCGRIGGGSNSAMFGNHLDRSQWYYACTSNGAHAYPYGDTYNAYVCSYDNAWGTFEVGQKSGCHSDVDPWDAAYDLSGNVSEWTDECEANTSGWDPCLTRGGSFFTGHDTTRVRCEDDSREIRSHLDYDLGFRCCAD